MTVDIKSLARLGAKARLAELVAEWDAILRAFPELGQQQVPSQTERTEAPKVAASRGRRRYRMSPAARKAASERMKRYWAERRKGSAAKKR